MRCISFAGDKTYLDLTNDIDFFVYKYILLQMQYTHCLSILQKLFQLNIELKKDM